jgi:hypothetical protein
MEQSKNSEIGKGTTMQVSFKKSSLTQRILNQVIFENIVFLTILDLLKYFTNNECSSASAKAASIDFFNRRYIRCVLIPNGTNTVNIILTFR